MARQIQIRRGTAAEHAEFTGAIGEITMDTTNKTLRIHDGETLGGMALAKEDEVNDKILGLLPDYTNSVVVHTSGRQYMAEYNGWYAIYAGKINASSSMGIRVNDIEIAPADYNSQYSTTSTMILCKKGDVISISGTYHSWLIRYVPFSG